MYYVYKTPSASIEVIIELDFFAVSSLKLYSDSSDSDSVELMTPLTTPIFDFH